MLCCVADCGRDARYRAARLCQMHYFRQRRGATTDLRRTPTGRYETPKGYQFVYEPDHPLAMSNGFVAEHRKVLFAKIGPGPMACELCGKAMTWEVCQPDHIDEKPRNNAPENLRPTCVPCNASRGHTPAHTWNHTHKITYRGETKTPAEWGRDPRVSVAGHTIVRRKLAGMSDELALFSPKRTHNGNTRRRDAKRRELEKA